MNALGYVKVVSGLVRWVRSRLFTVVGIASATAILPRLVFTMWGAPEVAGWQCRLVWDLARFNW